MITDTQKKQMSYTAEDIMQVLERQSFADWYNGEFEDYLTGATEDAKGIVYEDAGGNPKAPTRDEEILALADLLWSYAGRRR